VFELTWATAVLKIDNINSNGENKNNITHVLTPVMIMIFELSYTLQSIKSLSVLGNLKDSQFVKDHCYFVVMTGKHANYLTIRGTPLFL
jgi:hypothetical protein